MPPVKFKHVVSFSSEDKKFPAENLLKAETYQKWKCKDAGEKQASVILKFDKCVKISSVDIGNEGSAFVEILVGNSSTNEPDFKVLLPSSSFMSPSESKSEAKMNRVRMFDSENLSNTVLDMKWDLVKIVCNQPFNKFIKYGLSFITVHSKEKSDTDSSQKASTPDSVKLGAFTLKSSDKSDSITPGSLFSKRSKHELQSPEGATGKSNLDDNNTTLKIKKQDSSSKVSKARKYDEDEKSIGEVPKKKIKHENSKTSKSAKELEKKNGHTSSASDKKKPDYVKFDQLMKNVVFVLSGFQNPFRSELRNKALKMGAKCNSDWTSSSTHLICAFPNTPKYNSVKSKGGKIVKKEWITDSFINKKLMPWTSYSYMKVSASDADDASNSSVEETNEEKIEAESFPTSLEFAEDESTDIDTDDEIRSAFNQSKNDKSSLRPNTDEISLTSLPDFFKNMNFFLYGEFSSILRHNLNRYIIAFGGNVKEYMGESVGYVITESSWDDNFDDALECNSEAKFVLPEWIRKCAEKNKMVSITKFEIINS